MPRSPLDFDYLAAAAGGSVTPPFVTSPLYDPRIEPEPTIWLSGWAWLVAAVLLAGAFGVARRRPDYGLALVVAGLPLYQVRGQLGIPTTFLELLLGAVLLGLLVYRFWPPAGRSRLTLRRTPYDPWLALWVGGSLLAALLGPNLREGLGLWRAFFLEPVLFFYAVVAVFGYGRADPRALWWGAVGAIAGLVAWTGYLLGFGHAITYDDRLLGPFQSPNYLMLLLVPLTLLVAWSGPNWRSPQRPVERVARWTALGAAAALFLAANSRGAALGLLAALTVYLLWQGRRWLRPALGGLLLIGLLAGSLLGPRLVSHAEGRVVSSRPVIWREAIAVIRDDPWFGNGPGQFQDVFRERVKGNLEETLYVAPQALNPHNIWLVAWAEWGLLTLLALLALLATAVRTMFRRRPEQLVPAVMLAAIVVHGQVDTSIFKNDLAVLFMLTLALTVVHSTASLGRKSRAPRKATA